MSQRRLKSWEGPHGEPLHHAAVDACRLVLPRVVNRCLTPDMLTHERLLEVLDYDPETGVLTWRVSRGTARRGSAASHVGAEGYLRVRVDGRLYSGHRLVWLHVHGVWPDQIDHINGVRTDNRICNLREVTPAQNMQNKGQYRSNRSGCRGVSWHKKSGKWVAQITVDGKKHHLGLRSSLEDAQQLYLEARRRMNELSPAPRD